MIILSNKKVYKTNSFQCTIPRLFRYKQLLPRWDTLYLDNYIELLEKKPQSFPEVIEKQVRKKNPEEIREGHQKRKKNTQIFERKKWLTISKYRTFLLEIVTISTLILYNHKYFKRLITYKDFLRRLLYHSKKIVIKEKFIHYLKENSHYKKGAFISVSLWDHSYVEPSLVFKLLYQTDQPRMEHGLISRWSTLLEIYSKQQLRFLYPIPDRLTPIEY